MQDQRDQTQAIQPVVSTAPTQQQSIRMYAATMAEALEDMIVVTNMLLIGFVPARVLFDFGYTHSFISYAHKDRIGGKVED